MSLYADILKDEPGVHVPVRLPEFSTKRLLTMGWLEGERITDAAERDPSVAEAVWRLTCSVPGTCRSIAMVCCMATRISAITARGPTARST